MQFIYHLLEIVESFRTKVKIDPYIFVILSLGAGLFLEFILNIFLHQETYILLPVSVFLSAWYGGFIPGLVATIAGLLLADYFFIAPNYMILRTSTEIIRAAIFFVEGILFSLLGESRKKKEEERDEAFVAEKNVRKALEKADNTKNEFISIASHELKSPITAQKAFVQMLLHFAEKNKEKQYKEYLLKIDEQTNKLTRLINDLLNISKLQAGRLQMNYSYINVMDCISRVIEELQTEGITHKILVRGKLTRNVHADKERIEEVITNLLSNAIKYSPKANKVVLGLIERKKTIEVSVKDYGIGISKKDLPMLFTKYFRTEGVSEKKYAGFGMGLYIAAEIIRQHNGRIWVKSTKGKGSTFTFTLPINIKKLPTKKSYF